jgi:hypothetical protein
MAWPYISRKKGQKYGNTKVIENGIKFDSKKEAKRYYDLTYMQKAGIISGLELQKKYEFIINGHKVCSYVADFVYTNLKTGEIIVEDVKSEVTRKNPVYRIKCKLMKAIYGISIKEV